MPVSASKIAVAAAAYALTAALVGPEVARAADKDLCASSYLDAQRARRGGALLDARAHLQACLRECSDAARPDCATWLEEVERTLPSVVVVVERGGAEIDLATAWVDGRRIEDRTRALEVDPGRHRVRVEAGGTTTERDVDVREGEKARRVVVSLDVAPAADQAPSPRSPSTPAAPPAAADAPSRTPTVVFGVVAGVALGTFAVLGLYGLGRESKLDACAPRCQPDEVASVRRFYIAADVSLGVAVLAGAAAVVTYLLAPTGHTSARTAARR